MPKCSAKGCSTRMEKGRPSFRFPANLERRLMWEMNSGREQGTTSTWCKLCEVHFEASQFEQRRQDGKRKLRPYAVPTIFPGLPQPRPHPAPQLPSNPTDGKDDDKSQMAVVAASDHAYFKPKDSEKDDDLSDSRCSSPAAEPLVETPMEYATNEVHVAAPNVCVQVVNVSPLVSTKQSKLLDHNECKRKINFYRNEAKVAKRKLRETRERLAALEERLEGLFNRDQMQALQGKNVKKGVGNWTDSTVDRAFEIHNTIGKKAYNFLRDIGFPLPSMKTLVRRPRNDIFCIEEDVNDTVMPDHNQFNDSGANFLQILG